MANMDDIIEDEREYQLTTEDNPYNPYTNYDEWKAYDWEKGYYTEEYLGRIATTSFDLTDEENDAIINRAIDEIIRIDKEYGFNVGYTKAYKPK